jgi:hypothetical protein
VKTQQIEDIQYKLYLNATVCESAIPLWLLVFTICTSSINPTAKPKPRYIQAYKWQYFDCLLDISLYR